jgi:hypothetical protein
MQRKKAKEAADEEKLAQGNMKAVQAVQARVNEKLLTAAATTQEQEKIMTETLRFQLSGATNATKKSERQKDIDQAHKAQLKRATDVLTVLPAGTQKRTQLNKVYELKQKMIERRMTGLELMQEGPSKDKAIAQVWMERVRLNVQHQGIVRTAFPQGKDRDEQLSVLYQEEQDILDEAQAKWTALPDTQGKTKHLTEIEGNKKQLLQDLKDAVAKLKDGAEKKKEQTKLDMLSKMFFPNQKSSAEQKLEEELKEVEQKQADKKAEEEAKAAAAIANATKHREQIEGQMKQMEELVAQMSQGNQNTANSTNNTNTAARNLKESGRSGSPQISLDDAMKKLNSLKKEDSAATAAMEAAIREKQILKDTEFITQSSHRPQSPEEHRLVKQMATPLNAIKRVGINKMSAEERTAFMVKHYHQYHTHWHHVVHQPRSHEQLVNITQRLASMKPDVRKAVLEQKRALILGKREEEKKVREVQQTEVKKYTEYLTNVATQKSQLAKEKVKEAHEKLQAAQEASKEAKNKREASLRDV